MSATHPHGALGRTAAGVQRRGAHNRTLVKLAAISTLGGLLFGGTHDASHFVH